MTPANDNTPKTRPAAFDAAVVAYLPGLRKLARRLNNGNEDDADDLVSDLVARSLDRWQKFREDGSMWMWLSLNMRAIAQARRKTLAGRAVMVDHEAAHGGHTAATQDASADIATARRLLAARGRNGWIVLAHAAGASLDELAVQHSVSRTRITQIIASERRMLEAA